MRKVVFLYDKEQALKQFAQQLQYWRIEQAQIEQAFQFAVRNSSIHFQKLAEHLNVHHDLPDNAMQRLYVFQVGKHYFIEPIYSELENQCEQKFLQETIQIWLQYPLQSIQELFNWLQHYILVAERYNEPDDVATQLAQLVIQVKTNQRPSSRMKMIEIVSTLYQFKKGERHYNDVVYKIAQLKREWKRGKLALTIKERTILSYMAMAIAHTRSQWKKVVDEARFLLKQDRFMDVAIELIVEYGTLLKIAKPQPEAFIKNYRTSVFENFFFMYFEALTQLNEHKYVIEVLYDYEIASTSSIFHYLQQPTEDNLVAIEAAMQKNIALNVDQSVSYVKQSIDKWLAEYEQLPEAFVSSKYLCFLLETFFICEHYELFERLMAMYLKYIKFEPHYDCLKQRVSVHMALQT